jgi:hypothetical protein
MDRVPAPPFPAAAAAPGPPPSAPPAPEPVAVVRVPTLDPDMFDKPRPGYPLALRFDRVDSDWTGLDPAAIALPDGAVADIVVGKPHGRPENGPPPVVRISGPMAAGAVLGVILRHERDEPPDTVYPPDTVDGSYDCSSCPKQGFCGLELVGWGDDGVARWESLWSAFFCHSGIDLMLQNVYGSPDFFSPERASSNGRPVHPRCATQ